MGNGCSLCEALYLKFKFIESEDSFFKEAFKSNDYNNLIKIYILYDHVYP